MSAAARVAEDADERPGRPAERLCRLFEGAETRHGTYDPDRVRFVDGKTEMKDKSRNGPKDLPGPPTPDLWRMHLDGKQPLGVSPLREDGKCRWGVVDIDGKDAGGDYGAIDHAEIVATCERANIPVAVCRSKSGGAHVLLLLRDWTPQAKVATALKATAGRLGYPEADCFPLATGKGNWLNMPYFGGDTTDRYCIKPGGLAMTLDEFLSHADSIAMSPEDLRRVGAAPPRAASPRQRQAGRRESAAEELDRLAGEIAAQTEGGRNNLLNKHAFVMGKRIRDGLIDEDAVFHRLLQAAVGSGLAYFEATDTIKNGIRAGQKAEEDEARRPVIESMVVWRGGDETLWEITLAGHGTVKVSVKEGMNYPLFNMRCADTLRVAFDNMKINDWVQIINEALSRSEERQIAPDETRDGMLRSAVDDFLTNRHRGERIEDLLVARPFRDDDEERYYFRFKDLRSYLDTARAEPFRSMSAHALGTMLKELFLPHQYGTTTKKLCGKTTEVRWVSTTAFEEAKPTPGSTFRNPPV